MGKEVRDIPNISSRTGRGDEGERKSGGQGLTVLYPRATMGGRQYKNRTPCLVKEYLAYNNNKRKISDYEYKQPKRLIECTSFVRMYRLTKVKDE